MHGYPRPVQNGGFKEKVIDDWGMLDGGYIIESSASVF